MQNNDLSFKPNPNAKNIDELIESLYSPIEYVPHDEFVQMYLDPKTNNVKIDRLEIKNVFDLENLPKTPENH